MPPAITIERPVRNCRPVDRAAPQHDAVPARRPFVGETERRAPANGCRRRRSARRRARSRVRAVAVEEIGGDAAFVLAKRAEPMAGVDARLAEPRAHRLVDHAPAAGRDGWRTAARRSRHRCRAARARSPGRSGWCRTARRCGSPTASSRSSSPSSGQLLDGVRQRVDADAELADAVGLLVDLAVDAART